MHTIPPGDFLMHVQNDADPPRFTVSKPFDHCRLRIQPTMRLRFGDRWFLTGQIVRMKMLEVTTREGGQSDVHPCQVLSSGTTLLGEKCA